MSERPGNRSKRKGTPPSVWESKAYAQFLDGLKQRIWKARVRASLSVNRGLLHLYWSLGREIVLRQEAEGWGASVIERISVDLKRSFPGLKGFSVSNISRMRAFFLAYRPGEENVAQAVRDSLEGPLLPDVPDLPWGHQITLFEKVKAKEGRLWYGQMAEAHAWSRSVLAHQIESGLHERQGRAITNFERALPEAQSDLANELLKDPYHFDFLGLRADVREKDMEEALLMHLRDFLLELGVGFALVGSQFALKVGGQEYRIDLLFYHLRLRCYVVVDLKIGSFRPEDAGKMNFYLEAVDDLMGEENDHPGIGLILCKDRNRVVVEYALRGSARPIGVAGYRLTKRLPQELRGSFPSPEELRKGIGERA